MNELIRCINCDEVFIRTSSDQCPEYQYDPHHPSEPVQTIERDDFQDFLIHDRLRRQNLRFVNQPHQIFLQ
jgi:hypothetical protein